MSSSSGTPRQTFLEYPRKIIESVRPELNLFAVQMVSQPQLFCGLDQLVCCDCPSFKINCGKFWKNFPQKECNRYNSFRAVAPIRLRLVCLGLLNLDGYGCPKSLRFQRACLRLGHGILLPRLKGLRCGLGQYGYYLSKSV